VRALCLGRGRRTRKLARGVAAISVLAATACGSGAAAGSVRAPGYEVRATVIKGLGPILANGTGMTLYIYVPDHQGASACFLTCVAAWPPLLLPKGVSKPVAGPGVNAALLGTERRPDGDLQVTYNKWPLYLYRNDFAPGEANGQAESMGLWWVLSVNGAVNRGIAAGPATEGKGLLTGPGPARQAGQTNT